MAPPQSGQKIGGRGSGPEGGPIQRGTDGAQGDPFAAGLRRRMAHPVSPQRVRHGNSGLDKPMSWWQFVSMIFPDLERITFDPAVMGGKPCIRGMRVTVGMILGLIASGADRAKILRHYPYLEDEDISAALAYGSWRAEERELPMTPVR